MEAVETGGGDARQEPLDFVAKDMVDAAIEATAPVSAAVQQLSQEQLRYAIDMEAIEQRHPIKGARAQMACLGMPGGWGKTRLMAHHLTLPLQEPREARGYISFSRFDRVEKEMDRPVGDAGGSDLVIVPEYLMAHWIEELQAAGVTFVCNDIARPRPPVMLVSDDFANAKVRELEVDTFRRLVMDEAGQLRVPAVGEIQSAFLWLIDAWPGLESVPRNAPALVGRAVHQLVRYGINMRDLTLGCRAKIPWAVPLTITRWPRQTEMLALPDTVVAAYAETVGGFNAVLNLERWIRRQQAGAESKQERMMAEECPVSMEAIGARCVCPRCYHAFDVRSILRSRAHGNVSCPMCRKHPVKMTMQKTLSSRDLGALIFEMSFTAVEAMPAPMIVFIAKPVGKNTRAMLKLSLRQTGASFVYEGSDKLVGRPMNRYASLLIVQSTMCYNTRARERLVEAMHQVHRDAPPVIQEMLITGRCD